MSEPATGITPYRSTVTGVRDGFRQLLLAEWTKLRSVPRWMLTLGSAVVLTVLVALLTAGGAGGERAEGDGGGGGGPAPSALRDYQDQGHVVDRPLTGDGSVVARVTAQRDSHGWAKAGLMVKADHRPGSPYAAVMLTPDHGVRMQTGFTGDTAGSSGTGAPRWLKLTRSGDSVTGYESADGSGWSKVGTVRLDGLPQAVRIGMFVASPDVVTVERQFGGESIDGRPSDGRASFDHVRLDAERAESEPPPWRDRARSAATGGASSTAGGTFTLTGSGDIGPDEFADDLTRDTLSGVLVGMMAVVALGVLFVTAEYRRGTIRTTFAASPRRGRVLAAKAVVIGGAAFVAGLVAAVGSFLLAGPLLRSGHRVPPSLFDGPVTRAVLGTALLLAVVAVLALAVGTLLRHSAAAITTVLLLLLVPQIVATGLPVSAALWLDRVTPAAGFAVQQTLHRYDTAIGPWAGLGVLCGYTALALAAALWRLRTRDA